VGAGVPSPAGAVLRRDRRPARPSLISVLCQLRAGFSERPTAFPTR
jgi:hypothetical protein